MKHYPAATPIRFVCRERGTARPERGPTWPMFWRILAMGAVAFAVGLLLVAAFVRFA